MLNVGTTPQLFLDDLVIDRMEDCHRQLHRPTRYADNPVLAPDRPWELGPARNGVYLFGGTVLFDEEEQLFRMWYRSSEVAAAEANGPIGDVPDGGYRSCYAVSQDGLQWEKPNLRMVAYGDVPETNILPPGSGGRRYIRRPNLVKDYDEPDPDRRYKMVYATEVDGRWLLEKAFSPDGIRWRMSVGDPVFFPPPLSPLGILFGWDPRLGQYVHFHRQMTPGIPSDVDGRRVRAEAALMRSTSSNFEDWGDTEEVLRRDEQIDPPLWDFGHAGLLGAILYTDDLYIGFLDTCTPHDVADVPDNLWGIYQHDHAEHRTELVISRDGRRWTRVAPHWEFMRRGLWGAWNSEFVALSKPIVRNDEVLIYYTGRNVPCGAQIVGHGQRHLLGMMRDGQPLAYAIGLAKLRLDGFASIDGHDPGGTLTTRPLIFEGNRLVVNARAPSQRFGSSLPSREAFGRLRVAMLDAEGRPLAGYEESDCDPFSGDAVRHVVTWNGASDLGRLAGTPMRLRFSLRHAALYSFQVLGAKGEPSWVNLLTPGSRGRPANRGRAHAPPGSGQPGVTADG
ncbi:MAG: hypothetical protein ACRDJW_01185 [Thermomicrobiales bacterium]